MKKAIIIILVVIGLIGGFIFVTKSPNNQSETSGGSTQSVSGVLSETNKSLVDGHIRTAIKKQAIDATDQQNVDVNIGDFFFDPTVLKIRRGTTVTWTNNGMIGHDVKTDKSSPKQGPASKMLNKGDNYSFTFDEAGLYLYFCSPHPTQMRAAIEVVE